MEGSVASCHVTSLFSLSLPLPLSPRLCCGCSCWFLRTTSPPLRFITAAGAAAWSESDKKAKSELRRSRCCLVCGRTGAPLRFLEPGEGEPLPARLHRRLPSFLRDAARRDRAVHRGLPYIRVFICRRLEAGPTSSPSSHTPPSSSSWCQGLVSCRTFCPRACCCFRSTCRRRERLISRRAGSAEAGRTAQVRTPLLRGSHVMCLLLGSLTCFSSYSHHALCCSQ